MMEMIISQEGKVRCLYDEAVDLQEMGELHITRASHVEPDERGKWWADMSPVQGPQLGPYEKRSEAIGAEREWIEGQLMK